MKKRTAQNDYEEDDDCIVYNFKDVIYSVKEKDPKKRRFANDCMISKAYEQALKKKLFKLSKIFHFEEE